MSKPVILLLKKYKNTNKVMHFVPATGLHRTRYAHRWSRRYTNKMKKIIPHILWIDCLGAFAVGLLTLVFSKIISQIHILPYEIIIFFGVMNLVYGCYSIYLASRKNCSILQINMLSIFNVFWLPVCIYTYITFSEQISLRFLRICST